MLFHLLQTDTLGALAEQINQEAETVAQPTEMSTSLRVGFKTTINICVTIQLAFV